MLAESRQERSEDKVSLALSVLQMAAIQCGGLEEERNAAACSRCPPVCWKVKSVSPPCVSNGMIGKIDRSPRLFDNTRKNFLRNCL